MKSLKEIKQFSELTYLELEKLKKTQKLRAKKKNRDILDEVRCVGEKATIKENNRDEWKETFKIVETDTIKAYYAKLPVVDLGSRYMVQVLEPIPLIPVEKKLYLSSLNPESEPSLEELLLEEWKNFYRSENKIMGKDSWVYKVNKVELIECDLLVPKEK